ncbi:hypothetical protein [Polaribacter porphyrae]|uniref:Cadherin domain-containing protein n=1 Tax=Polaribacter porphyrae TaxID=1137780 RepID=A0A2S7WPS9_9FLAO|nr:hypothetical protein [Polaribacter porphyrae]PQJ79599.1 hypothetical protein BTO18_10630 [Polaribacter porphyrae]
MKNIKTKILLFITIFALVIACSDDDSISVNSTPEFQTVEKNISSLPGQTFTFKAVVSDPAGIKSVNFKYEPWFLDKTIIKDSLPTSYEISYNFKVPSDATENSIHTIPLTVTNAGDKMFTENIVITLDKDIAAPIINIASPIDGSSVLIGTTNEIILDITLTDKELQNFKIESELLNEDISISGTSFSYKKELDVANPKSYSFKITATDVTGNVASKTVSINVLNSLSFDQMYITDVTDDAELSSDLFGIPFTTTASTATTEDGFVFTGKYYSEAPNSEVRFLAQKTSFSPFSFGGDANNSGTLALGSDVSVNPIILPEVGYYEIKMDLRDSSYTLTKYTPTDTAFGQVYIIGTGVYIDDTISTCTNNNTGGNTCWNFASGKPFTKNANNDYLWTIDVTLKEEPSNNGSNGFILNANPAGWSPFWRLDDGVEPTATVPNGGTNFIFPDSALDKDYTFKFDTHLNRISVTIR